MAVFIISYDLRKPDHDYKPLYAALGEINATHLQDSMWGVRTDSKAEVVFDYLWQYVHSEKDRLAVMQFTKTNDYKSKNAMTLLKDL